MNTFEIIQSVASIATAIGVAIAAWQLRLSKRQAQSQFEDTFAEQYRSIASSLPLDALLGRPLSDQELNDSLRIFYNYFDLSNEQAFLAAHGRLRPETWENWREGIQQHLARPAFSQAWEHLSPDLDGSFDELKKLLPSEPSKNRLMDRSQYAQDSSPLDLERFTEIKNREFKPPATS